MTVNRREKHFITSMNLDHVKRSFGSIKPLSIAVKNVRGNSLLGREMKPEESTLHVKRHKGGCVSVSDTPEDSETADTKSMQDPVFFSRDGRPETWSRTSGYGSQCSSVYGSEPELHRSIASSQSSSISSLASIPETQIKTKPTGTKGMLLLYSCFGKRSHLKM